MPLHVAKILTEPAALAGASEKFLIFFSNIVNGKLWCPDCVAVDDTVKKTFEPAEGPSGLLIYVGDRAEWKTLANPFRAEPLNIQSIPTIIRLKDGKEDARLELDEITEAALKAFTHEREAAL